MSKVDVVEILKKSDALLEGHFLLSSGKHSNRYVQCAKVLRFPEYAEQVLSTVVEQIKDLDIDLVGYEEINNRIKRAFDIFLKEEGDKYFNKLWKICEKYHNYGNFSFIYDREGLLELKDSPSDKGEDVFNKLLDRRVIVK